MNRTITLTLLFIFAIVSLSAQKNKTFKHTDDERTQWDVLLKQKPEWYQCDEAIRIAENVLLFQRSCGGWPKNINMGRELLAEEIHQIIEEKNKKDATIDNGTTYTHLRYLAKVYQSTQTEIYKEAFINGFNYLMEAQYENGGWPQFYPLKKGYSTHITYNDDAMTGVLFLLKDISELNPDFSFLTKEQVLQAETSLDKGIEITLKAQIKKNGKLTGWCAQHDEFTLLPANARSYELASISGSETVRILEFLMSIDPTTPEIKTAILSACNWFEEAKITEKRLTFISDSTASEDSNRLLIDDENGPDLWARFYSLETGKPLWVDREGVICNSYNQISDERRNNYAFVGQFAHQLLTEELPEWKKKHNIN